MLIPSCSSSSPITTNSTLPLTSAFFIATSSMKSCATSSAWPPASSMVLGEPQILGQIKRAYALAREAGGLNGSLQEIVNQALAVARRVRRETALGSAAVSVSYAAVELAKKIFGSLEGKAIFVIGVGQMSELAAKHLICSGASAIYVTNRTYERAVQLAAAFGDIPVQFDHSSNRSPKLTSSSAPRARQATS